MLIVGCGDGTTELDDGTDEPGVKVVGGDFDDPPEGGLQFVLEDMEIPPHEERQYCLFGTYKGETAGIVSQIGLQDAAYGHHMTMLSTLYPTSDFPDGTLMDCSDKDSLNMILMEPLFVSGSLELPPGMGLELESGTRYIVQSHYINTTADTLIATDAINIGLKPESEINTWIASVAHSTVNFEIPVGESATFSIDCVWEEEVELVYLSSHMHQWGEAFSVDYTPVATGATERIYDIEQWLPEHRDDPPGNDMWDAPMHLVPGDMFTTRCTWFNDTDEVLGFPQEMCAAVGMAYPLRSPVTCADIF